MNERDEDDENDLVLILYDATDAVSMTTAAAMAHAAIAAGYHRTPTQEVEALADEIASLTAQRDRETASAERNMAALAVEREARERMEAALRHVRGELPLLTADHATVRANTWRVVESVIDDALGAPEAVDRVARAICREKCAFYGEPPCFTLEDDDGNPVPWPNPHCDEPGCGALAMAALLATPVQQEPGDGD